MESPLSQSPVPLQRVRTNSGISVHSGIDPRGAIRKPILSSRGRSISTSQADRLYQLAVDQTSSPQIPPTSVGIQWLTPQPSPQLHGYPDVALEPFPVWTVPTPPRSDSGVPSVSVDASEDAVTSGIAASPELALDDPIVPGEMSSLGFLLPAQYGSGVLEAEPTSYTMDGHYMPPVRGSHPQMSSGPPSAAHTASSSPTLYQSRSTPLSHSDVRRVGEFSSMPPSSDPGFPTSDYRQRAMTYDAPVTTADYSVGPSQTVPSIAGMTHSPMHSPHLSGSSMVPQYPGSLARSPNMYDHNMYAHSQAYTSAPAPSQLYAASHSMSYPPPFVGSSVNEVLSKPLGTPSSIRVLNQRPKPQCWEHGCNGRQFSTFSNLLRHQREKSGTAAKAYCPKCGAEFTRTTARNGHLAHDKCTRTGRQPSDSQ